MNQINHHFFHSLVARQSSWSDASRFSSIFDKVDHKQINFFPFFLLVMRATAQKKHLQIFFYQIRDIFWIFFLWQMKKIEVFLNDW